MQYGVKMGPTKMTPEDQQFNISFVAEVKQYPCLFDSNSTEYKQAQVQDKAWQAVSGAVNESVDMCKKRWRNLRCCMTRYLKSVRDNMDTGANLKRRPYYLYNHMQFVVPYLKMKDNDGSVCETDETVWMKGNSTDMIKSDEGEDEDHEIETIDVQEEDHQQIKQSIIQSIKILPMNQDQPQETTTTYEIIDASPTKQPRLDPFAQVNVTTQAVASKQKDPSNVKHYTYAAVTSPQQNATTLYTSSPVISGAHTLHVAGSSNSNYQQRSQLAPMPINSSAATDADNNFFKSLIPDIQSMNMDQKRKLKIGILRLIDEILSTT